MTPASPPRAVSSQAFKPASNSTPYHDGPQLSLATIRRSDFSRGRFFPNSAQPPPRVKDRQHWIAGGISLLFFIASAAGMSWSGKLLGKAPFTGPTWTVLKEKLKVAIVERGTLESARNGDIICTVRSGTKGSTIATTIKWIIEPGVQVVKGDKLVELDSSGFVEQLKDQRIKVDQAKAAWVTANEQYHIQESQNESDIEAAKNTLELARIDLERYEKAEFVQALEDVDGRIEIARADLDVWQTRSQWSSQMAGKGYMTKSQANGEESQFALHASPCKKRRRRKGSWSISRRRRTIQDLSTSWRRPAAHSIGSRASPERNWSRPMRTGWPRTPSTNRS